MTNCTNFAQLKAKSKRRMLISLFIIIAIVALFFTDYVSIGRVPHGKRLERCQSSPNYKGGKFVNLEHVKLFTDSTKKQSMVSIIWNFIFSSKKGLKPTEPVKAEPLDKEAVEQAVKEKKDLVVWFGHSSYLLVIGGKTILVDPVLFRGSPVSFINRPFKGTSIYKPDDFPNIDYLVITHDHYDHLDYKAARKLKHKVYKAVMPLGVGSHLEYWGYDSEKLVEMDWNERYDDGVTFICSPAKHFSGRSFKRNKTLWASFILQIGDKCVFIGGDGGYGKHFKKIGEEYDIDWAFIENGQYSGRWAQIHTMPHELHKVMQDLDAKHYITVHHSKFALSQHDWWEPRKNEQYASEESGKDLIVLRIGQIQYLQ
ncbi:MAG: MBL fold metallo-hydrolase [Bacteroidales bacterium]|nr:MBL fold metallo-hydrolase [Bacteroidales bacterium]